jgi:PTS system mannose-specific IIA component
MIGLLIVTHRDLGREFLNAAEFIVGGIEAADAVAINHSSDSEKLHKIIADKVKTLDRGQGVLILTDMFGGTPSNLSLSFLQEEMVEVLTGVNLPMVISIVQNRTQHKLNELAEMAQKAAKMGISLAGKLLESG